MEGEIGERERRLGSKGQNPRGVERVHRAVNPLRRPRSPLPAPASQPSALLSSIPAWGRDPVEGDTAPRADSAAWNPEEEPGYRQPLASRFCGAHDPQDPGAGTPMKASRFVPHPLAPGFPEARD